MSVTSRFYFLVGLALLASAVPGWGAAYSCGPNQTITLNADLALNVGDTVDWAGTAGNVCTIRLNNHSVTGTPAHFVMRYVSLQDAGAACNPVQDCGGGTPSVPAFSLTLSGNASLNIEHTTWVRSSNVMLELNDASTASIRYNYLPEDSIYPVTHLEPGYPWTVPAFHVDGTSTGTKVFAGNVILKSWVDLGASTNWIVGSSSSDPASADADANLVIGPRAGFAIGGNSVYLHNYTHTKDDVVPWDRVGPAANDGTSWSQTTNLRRLGSGSVAADNIIRGSNWIVQLADGEVRNNVLSEIDAASAIRLSTGPVHHNIIASSYPGVGRYNDPSTGRRWYAGAALNRPGQNSPVYNNTFDPRGIQLAAGGIAVGVNTAGTSFAPSIRSNAFIFESPGLNCGGRAVIDQQEDTCGVGAPFPVGVTYSDYNLFHFDPSPGGHDVTYQVGVSSGLTHDQTVATTPVRGPLPIQFPFDDRDILSGAVTVSQILNYYRSVYAPAAGSALLGGQDPQDGAGDIGAIQSATAPAPYTTNVKPAVYAGPDITEVWPTNQIFLQGYGGDDGLPNGVLNLSWSKISGPGSVSFEPKGYWWTATFSAPGTYVLRLTASDGTLSNSDDMAVTFNTAGTLPSVNSFMATPSAINPAQSATLSWSVSGANAVTIDHGVGTVASQGSQAVFPSKTTTYTLTATGTNGAVTATATVTVSGTQGVAPVILSFGATPASVNTGTSSTLSWIVSEATSVSIDQGVGSVTGLTATSVFPAATTIYTLTASNTFGTVTATAAVTVNSFSPPPTQGLAVYYSFTSAVGSTISDDSGNGVLAVNRGVTAAVGQVGGGAQFSGNAAYLGQSNASSVLTSAGNSGSITITAWIKPASTAGIQALLIKGQPGVCFNYGAVIYNGKLNAINKANFYPVSSTLTANSWQHVAIVFNAAGATGYINGAQSGAISQAVTTNCPNNGWAIGANSFDDPGWFYSGVMDEVRIYNRALTLQEIINIYNYAGVTGPDTIPPIISGVLSSGITSTSATITWNTDESSDSQVQYGVSPVYGSISPLDSASVTSHSVLLTSLSPNTTYNYAVQSRDAASNLNTSGNFTFTTAPIPPPPPVVTSFTAGPPTINQGQTATLSWSVTGATSLSIDHGVGTVTNLSSTTVSPAITTTYTLTATNGGGSVTATATVTVLAPPVISNFTASPATVVPGGTATLSWSVSNATSLSIDQGVGTVTGQISTVVSPSVTTVYTLTATNTAGSSTATTTVSVGIVNPPSTVGIGAYYSVDSVTTGIMDSSGNGVTALNRGVLSTAGQVAGGALFNGASYFGQPSASSGLLNAGNAGSVTVAAWIKPSSILGLQSIFLKGQTGTCFNYGIIVSGGVLNAVNSSNFFPVSGALTANTWQHVAIVYNASGAVGYINGVASGSKPAALTTNCSRNGWAAGSRGYDDPGWYFTGALDEVRVYNRALSAQEVFDLFAYAGGGSGGNPPVISGVTSSAITQNTATITWTTDVASDSQVDYGLDNTYGSSTTLNSALVASHSVNLTGLSAGSAYHYRVRSSDASSHLSLSGDYTFSTVAAGAPPTINSFTASPSTIASGQSSTLSWSVTGATSLSLDNGVGTVTGQTSISVSPSASTTYTLAASNGTGTVTATATVTVGSSGGLRLQAGPGETVTLSSNLVLAGTDEVSLVGSATNPCTLQGNGHSINGAAGWAGKLTVQYCTLSHMGAPTVPAFNLNVSNTGNITIENSTWDLSSNLWFTASGAASISIRYNVVPETAIYAVSHTEPGTPSTQPFLYASGSSTGSKVFAGNRVYKSYIRLESATGWLIGVDPSLPCSGKPEDSNIISGLRGGLWIGANSTVRCNYIHPVQDVFPNTGGGEDNWSQVTNVIALGQGSLAEYNIFHSGNWITRGVDGELRYNVLLSGQHYFISNGTAGTGKIHHNILNGVEPPSGLYGDPSAFPGSPLSMLEMALNSTQAVQISHNTFDAREFTSGESAYIRVPGPYASLIQDNSFSGIKLLGAYNAAIDQGATDAASLITPPPARVSTSMDYNAFHYQASTLSRTNYNVGVTGKAACAASSGANDVGGCPNGTLTDPQFRGPMPRLFPFQLSAIKSGAVSIQNMLDYYASVYVPADGSPLTGRASDGGDIGAVQRNGAPAVHTTNLPPAPYAGPDLTIVYPATAFLNSFTGDDCLPVRANCTVSETWSKVSGPGNVTFTKLVNFSWSAAFTEPGTYVLRLTSSDGELTATGDTVITVTGGGLPSITTFAASPATIVPGQSTTLSWVTSGATSLSINNGIGTVTGSNTTSVSPAATTIYTLTASNTSGAATATATVTVNSSSPPPVVTSFTAGPPTINQGQTATLSWSVTGATSLSIDHGVGTVTNLSSTTVSPAITTTYTLTATNGGGSVTATATVTVLAPPVISNFTASPATVVPGGTATLSWSVSNATSLSIDQGVGTVTGQISTVVSPSVTTVYTLTATNTAGSSTATTTVSVGIVNPPSTVGIGAYYSVDSVTTGIMDSSGNGVTALNRGVLSTAGQVAGGALFNGASYFGQPSASSGLLNAGNAGSVTVAAWIKPSSILGLQSIFLKGQTGTCFNYGIIVSGGVLNAVNSSNFFPVSGALTANTWQHVAIVYNASGAVGYINGVASGSKPAALTTNCSRNGWAAGSRGYDDPGWYFTGALDEVRVYNRALSAQEVFDLFAYAGGGSGGNPPVISGVTSSAITQNTATITWTTDVASDSQVDYGLDNTYGSSTTLNSALVASHSVNLTGLSAGSAYHYRVRSSDASSHLSLSGDYTFSTVAAGAPPTINSFTASPSTIASGQSSTLSWSVTGATSLSLDNGVGTVTGQTSISVSPSASTTYTLTASNGTGTVTATALVTVTPSNQSYTCAPGQTVNFTSDLILGAADTVDWVGSSGSPCVVNMNGHSITGTPAHFTMQYVTLQNAGAACNPVNDCGGGTPSRHAINVILSGTGYFTIEHSTWARSSSIYLGLNDSSTASVRYNQIPADSLFPIAHLEAGQPWTVPFLQAAGTSSAPKVFAGNVVLKSWIDLSGSAGWTVGSTSSDPAVTDADANIVVGLRAGFGIGSNSVFQHNYTHALEETLPWDGIGPTQNNTTSWSQLVNLHGLGAGSLASDSIFRTGVWVVQGVTGEFRNNIISEMDYSSALRTSSGPFHHNIIAASYPGIGLFGDATTGRRSLSGVALFLPNGQNSPIYNNTFDPRGTIPGSTNIAIAITGIAPSIRSNAFVFQNPSTACTGRAVIDQDANNCPVGPPYFSSAAYSDYNLFHFDPNGSGNLTTYQVAVTAGQSHDQTVTANPLRGPLPNQFPFDDRDIISGVVTVSQILNYYRSVYAPATGSPLIGHQDPQDGAGDIGAVQSTTAPAPYTANWKPSVWAGPDINIVWPTNQVLMQGFAGDDGLPNGVLNTSWSLISGPAPVTFTPVSYWYTATFSAPGTYTLRLTASDGALTNSDDVVITIAPGATPPAISSFTASPGVISGGQSTTLSWSASNATVISIDHGVGAVTGLSSVVVSPAATTTYTFTASNANGTVTATATVTVNGTPVISSFTASPSVIAPGGSSNLSWSVSGATSLFIDQGVGTVTGLSSIGSSPAQTTTYTLSATNSLGTTTSSVTVTVSTSSPPPTLGLTAYYSFDSGVGSPVTDVSGNGNAATNRGVTATAGQIAGGASFGGAAFFGQPNAASGLTNVGGSGNVTVTAWIKPVSTAGIQAIMVKGQSGICFNYGIMLYNGTLNALNSSNLYSLSGSLAANTWQHVAIVYSAAGATGYINGIQTGVKGAALTSPCSVNGWAAGSRGYDDPGWYFTGLLDELRVYNRALNAQEIANIFSYAGGGTSVNPPVISNVVTSGITQSAATINWTTDTLSDTQVEYGTTAGYGSLSALDGNLVTSHSVVLTGLTAGTQYYYRVRSRDGFNNLSMSAGDVLTTASGPPAPPTISSFGGGPSTITQGQSATLSWTTTNATALSINNGVGTVTGQTSAVVSPAATTTYTLTATNAGGSVTSTTTVTVVGPPTITSFTATPSTITLGGSSTLAWSIVNATSVSIDQGVGTVTGQSSKAVSPTATTTYTISASNTYGTSTALATVTLGVIGLPSTVGLSVYYPLENLTGSTVPDGSGNGNTAVNNGATAAAGQVAGAATFGGSAYIGQPNNGSGLNNAGNRGSVTVAAWVRLSSTAGLQAIFTKGQAGVCFNYGMMVNGGALNAINSSNFYPVSGTLAANIWQHVAIVYSNNGATGYVNGVQTGVSIAAATSDCTRNGWAIGSRGYDDPGWFLSGGLVDEFRVYGRALSAQEISDLYHFSGN